MILRFVDCFKNILDILFFFFKIFNECLDKGFFPDELKCAEVAPVYKKRIIITIDLSVFCLIYQNYMKGVCINNLVNIFDIFIKVSMRFHKKIQGATLPFSDVGKMKTRKTEATKEFLLRFSLTSPKLLTAYLTFY